MGAGKLLTVVSCTEIMLVSSLAKNDLENVTKINIQGFQSKSFHQIRAKLDVQNFHSKSLQHIGTETNFEKF